MKRKKTKTKETDARKNVNRKKAVSDVDHSRLTIHDSRSSSRFRFFNDSRFHIACLVVLILIIYSNTLNAPFQWDEDEFLVNNPIVNNLHYFASPSDARGLQYYGHLMERYVGYLTFALNYKMHGFSVPGYHIVNITIHVANSVLVYLLVLLTFRTPFFTEDRERGKLASKKDSGQAGMTASPYLLCHSGLSGIDSRPLIAFFSAALFAVHPLQTEAVTYVFQRFVPLTALFSLISLIAYVQSRLAEGKQQRLLFYCIAFISAVLAMKTKETAFTLPIVIALYEFCFFSRFTKSRCFGSTSHVSRFLYLAPMLLTMSIIPLTLIYLKWTMSAGRHDLPGVSYAMLPRGEYMLTQFRVIVTYLRLQFLPVNQNFDYDYPVFKSVFDPQVILSFLFLAALFAFGVYLLFMRRNAERSTPNAVRLIGFGILWFFITLSVESSIVPLDRLIDEYRVYLPSVGISIAVVTGAFFVFSRFTLRLPSLACNDKEESARDDDSPFTIHYLLVLLVSLVLVTGVLAIATYKRNEVWGDRIGLWEDTVKKSPGSADAHYSLGVAYQTLNMPEKAMGQYQIAVNLRPDHVEAHNNLGNIYKNFNMPDKAMEQYLIAVNLSPDYAEAHFNLGAFLYYRMGQKENARRELMAGLKIKPDDQEAQQLLNEISR